MAKVLYFDCFAGASGDMVLGALLDLGLPLDELERALGGLLPSGASLSAERVLRSGLSAVKFRLHEPHAAASSHEHHHDHEHADGHAHDHEHHHPHSHSDDHSHDRGHAHAHEHAPDHAHDHGHAHSHGHAHDHQHAHPHDHQAPATSALKADHGHRTLAEIAALIGASALTDTAKARSLSLFRRLAEAEAQMHDMSVEQVHLHEVGALDSIVDIVGAVFGLEWLRVDRFVASPLNVGGGMVRSAHGVFPVPAPATLKLLEGAPVYSSGIQMETVTPTGALLVAGHATSFGPVPSMRVSRVGYGAGDRDLPGTPNVLRLVVGEDDGPGAGERVVVLECEIDDMNPQLFGVALERLYAAGALEVYYTPVQMKKNRPGTLLTVVGHPGAREALSAIVFRETTTIGLRYQEVARMCLTREIVTVQTAAGPVRVKVARRGADVLNASPEFDDCVKMAAEHGVPVKHVQALATRAYLESRDVRS